MHMHKWDKEERHDKKKKRVNDKKAQTLAVFICMSQIFYREEKRPKLSPSYHIWHVNFSVNLFTWHIKSACVTNGDKWHYKKGSSFWWHLCLWHELFIFTYLVKTLIKVTVWSLHRRILHQQNSVILTLLVRTCYQFTSILLGLVNSWASSMNSARTDMTWIYSGVVLTQSTILDSWKFSVQA